MISCSLLGPEERGKKTGECTCVAPTLNHETTEDTNKMTGSALAHSCEEGWAFHGHACFVL